MTLARVEALPRVMGEVRLWVVVGAVTLCLLVAVATTLLLKVVAITCFLTVVATTCLRKSGVISSHLKRVVTTFHINPVEATPSRAKVVEAGEGVEEEAQIKLLVHRGAEFIALDNL